MRHDLRPYLMAAFCALKVMDVASTVYFVDNLGVDMEANPVMHWLISNWGLGWFVGVQAIVVAFWLSIGRLAKTWIHWALVLIHVPVVWMGMSFFA